MNPKKLIAALVTSAVLCVWLALSALAAGQWSPRQITLAWDYDPSEETTNMVFNVRFTTNLLTPLPWPLLTNTPGTNRSVVIGMVPHQYYFYATASNFWGESDPSNTVATPRTVGATANLAIRRP